jgi:nucleotide-binding universal stress UspA family protein
MTSDVDIDIDGELSGPGPILVSVYAPGDMGQAVLEATEGEAVLRRARVVVVNLTRGEAFVDPAFGTDEALEKWTTDLDRLGVPYEVRSGIVDPDIGSAVLDIAESIGATMIVVAVPPRSRVGKLILGSVPQRILLGAHCPVLAVKAAH